MRTERSGANPMFARAVRDLLSERRGNYATLLIFTFSPDANASIEPGSLNPARITSRVRRRGRSLHRPGRSGRGTARTQPVPS